MSEIEEQIAEEMEPEVEDGNGNGGEPPETETGTDTPNEPEDAAPGPRSQKEIEELQAKLAREAERHSKRVAEIMGDDFALLVPSPVDWTPGFIFNVPEMLPFPEQVAQFDALLGRAASADYLTAEDAEACERCNALGLTLTGSKVEGQITKPCGKCNGTGWTTKMPPLAQVAQMPAAQTTTSGQPVSPATYQVKDSWGRPNGHPHFGIDPVSITG